MAFTLRILFTGLLAFVPNTDESKGMRVLMIDGRAPGLASNGESHVSHIAAVRFNLVDLASDCKQPAYQVSYSSDALEARGQWVLNGDDLELRCDGKSLPDRPLTILKSDSPQDFALVPTMQLIYPESNGMDVRVECLDPTIKRLSEVGLVGRIRLQAGVVGSYAGHNGKYITADEMMFTHSPSLHRQRMASCVFYETEIDAPSVELFSRQRGKGLVFRPQDGQLVEILIENEPPPELIGAKPGDLDVDIDFELVYRVAKNPPSQLRVPIRATAAMSLLQNRQGHPAMSEASQGALYPPVDYSPHSEADDGRMCGPIGYNPSSEALSGLCIPATFNAIFNPSPEFVSGSSEPNPSREAAGSPMMHSNENLNLSSESVTKERVCMSAIYNTSSEMSISPLIHHPSSEALVAFCIPTTFNAIFNPSREESGGSTTPDPNSSRRHESEALTPSRESSLGPLPLACDSVTYNSSSQSTDGPAVCGGATLNPSSEAINPAFCVPATFNPSAPSSESATGPRVCGGATLNPNSEASAAAHLCLPVTLSPSSEAINPALCIPNVYNPNDRA